MGVYATAPWLIGLADGLAELADPAKDRRVLETDIRQAARLRAIRTRRSLVALSGKKMAE